jgi:hypothetical protein
MARSVASLTGVALLCALAAACDKPGVTEQQKENRATDQNVQTQGQAEQQFQNAQANAEKQIAAARVEFEKTREDYLHDKRTDLADLDEKIANMDATEKTATGKKKAQLDAQLPQIRAQRDAFARHMQSLSVTPPSAWDESKANLDKEWGALKNAVDNTPSR